MSGPTKQMAIRFPNALYEKIKKKCVDLNVSFTEYILLLCSDDTSEHIGVCKNCHYQNPEYAYICRQCGTRLNKEPVPVEAFELEFKEMEEFHKKRAKEYEDLRDLNRVLLEEMKRIGKINNEKLVELIESYNYEGE